MRNKYVQMSLLEIYHNVGKGLKNDKPELFKLLDEHINWDELVSDTFCHAFYQRFGRNRKCDLDSFNRIPFDLIILVLFFSSNRASDISPLTSKILSVVKYILTSVRKGSRNGRSKMDRHPK